AIRRNHQILVRIVGSCGPGPSFVPWSFNTVTIFLVDLVLYLLHDSPRTNASLRSARCFTPLASRISNTSPPRGLAQHVLPASAVEKPGPFAFEESARRREWPAGNHENRLGRFHPAIAQQLVSPAGGQGPARHPTGGGDGRARRAQIGAAQPGKNSGRLA